MPKILQTRNLFRNPFAKPKLSRSFAQAEKLAKATRIKFQKPPNPGSTEVSKRTFNQLSKLAKSTVPKAKASGKAATTVAKAGAVGTATGLVTALGAGLAGAAAIIGSKRRFDKELKSLDSASASQHQDFLKNIRARARSRKRK